MFPDLFLKSQGTGPRLRIGLLLDSFVLPRCFQQVIEHINRSDFASIELIVLNQATTETKQQTPQPKWKSLLSMLRDAKRRPVLGYSLYQKFDARYFKLENDPLESIDCTEELADVKVLPVTPIAKGFTHRFMPEDINQIRDHKLDILLRFGFNIIKGDILSSAKYGVWSYHHGDNNFYRGGPAYFWELFEDCEFSGVILQVLTEELDGGKVLAKALFATAPGMSLRRNRYTPYWGSVTMFIQKAYELHSFGWDHVLQRSLPDSPYVGKRKIYRKPTNSEIGRWFLKRLLRIGWARARRIILGKKGWQWRIAWRAKDQLSSPDKHFEPRTSFQWLPSPNGHFHADPFLLSEGGRTWMFFEDYVYSKRRAVICCRELLPDGRLGDIYTVLVRPYHLSYPFVFRHDGVIYMIPESERNQSVELYRAIDFPYKWTQEKILFQARAMDTTPMLAENGVWFFTTFPAAYGDGICLCIFFADSLTGEWQSHPCNPVSMDVRHARSGGRILNVDGKLYRVSQSGAPKYGSSFSFHEIVTLTRTEYREDLKTTICPWGGYRGVHTFDRSAPFEVIDGVTLAPESRLKVEADFPTSR